eukprot:gene3954-6417_t
MADDWIVDSIAGFLASPPYTTPVTNFIETNCLEFSNGEGKEAVHFHIHQKYQELGITPDQFNSVMEEAETSKFPRITPVIFATVAAADDLELFKSLMINKNYELELETRAFFSTLQGSTKENESLRSRPSTAASLHRSRTALPTEMRTCFDDSQSEKYVQDETAMLQRVLEASLEEYKASQQSVDRSHEEDLNRALELSAKEYTELLQEMETASSTLYESLQAALQDEPSDTTSAKEPAEQTLQQSTTNQASLSDLPSLQPTRPQQMPSGIDSLLSAVNMNEVEDDDKSQFASVLKKQRKKLIARRTAERMTHLDDYNKSHVPASRKPILFTSTVPREKGQSQKTEVSSEGAVERPVRISSAVARRIRKEAKRC